MNTWHTLRAAVAGMALALALPAFSQWENAGLPGGNHNVKMMYTDSLHDWLLVALQGQPIVFQDSSFPPLYRYNSLDWDTLGLFGNLVTTAVIYHDTLIVGGGFEYVRNSSAVSIACYANGAWHPYGTFSNGVSIGVIQRLRVIDDTLYALGIFETADGQYCQSLARRVGGHWEPVPGWSELTLNADPRLSEIIRYQGKLIVSGNFSSQDLTLRDMLQYDGNAWVPVCNGCLMGGMDGVGSMVEYQGYLYVGGIFFYATGNAGQGIMRWNGQQWSSLGPVGDGLQVINYSDQYSPDIHQLQVRDGLLYIGGYYDFVDHQPVPAGICTWDGWAYCLLEGEPFAERCAPFAFYHVGDLTADYTDLELVSTISTMETFQKIYRPEIYNANSPATEQYQPSLKCQDYSLTRIVYDREERSRLAVEQGRFVEERFIKPYRDVLDQWSASFVA